LDESLKPRWVAMMGHLKVVNCCSRSEWEGAMKVPSWACPGAFENVWAVYKNKGLFEALCMLDEENLVLLMGHAVGKSYG